MLLSPLVALALTGLSPPTSLATEGFPPVQVLDRRQGFTGTYPSRVVVDPAGRTWVSTDMGELFLGDGLRFIKMPLPPALAGRAIRGLASDGSGRLWMLTAGGLGTWDKGAWQVNPAIRQGGRLPGQRVDDIQPGAPGELLVLAEGHLYRISAQGGPEPLSLPGTEPDGELRAVWRTGELVVARGRTFWHGLPGAWSPLPSLTLTSEEVPKGPLRADAAGHLYLLTTTKVHHLAPGAPEWRPLPIRSVHDGHRITRLQDGRVWMFHHDRALCLFEGHVTERWMPPDLSLFAAEAQCLDPEGNLWVTSTVLARLPALGLVLRHLGPGRPPAREVWRILRHPDGSLWVALEIGLYRQDASGWSPVPGVAHAHGLAVGPDGKIYLRSRSELLRVDARTLRVERVPIRLPEGSVGIRKGPLIASRRLWCLDARDRLMEGTWNGRTWSWALAELPDPSDRTIRGFTMDEFQRPWLFSQRRTCVLLGNRWEPLPALEAGVPVSVTFWSESEGLAATFNPPGVHLLRRESGGWTVRPVLRATDLPGVGVLYAVRGDGAGGAWIGTDRGLLHILPGGRMLRLGFDLGLPAEDTNQEALLVEGPDRVWVGTVQGLAEVRPRLAAAVPPLTAPLVLETQDSQGIHHGGTQPLVLRHRQGSARFELGFPGPVRGEGARFEFREPGRSWVPLAGTALQFPETTPGRHAYEVRVHPAHGEPGPVRRLEFQVLPPWYRHPAAYAAWSLILAGGLALGVHARMALLRRRNRDLRAAVAQATEGLQARERELEVVNHRLYALNDAKNRIIALAAHDLRNPLSGILLHTELLTELAEDPEVADSAAAIQRLGTTMKDLIQRLLDIHAIEAGHAEVPQPAVVDLALLLAQARDRISTRAAQKDMSLVLENAGVAQGLVDEAQVAQILDNYLSNATKYAPPRTTITLRLVPCDAAWRMEVQDQGPGLTDEDLTRVFGAYERLSARPTGGEPSVGLGLSLVKRLAEAMGGRVGVESRAGKGATFWVELPKA